MAVITDIMITMSKEGMTTIQVSKETAEKLARMGKKGDSYEAIIQKLLKKAGK
jgi:predicted CopG family antitoxin